MKETFDFIIANTVNPLLKKNGFKKSALTYYKIYDSLIYVIDLQKSRGNNNTQIDFYVNCCIHSIEIDKILNLVPNIKPKEYECHFRKRIEEITNYENDRFSLTIGTDLASIQSTLDFYLRQAIEFLLNVNNNDELAKLLIQSNGLYNFEKIISFLISSNHNFYLYSYIQNLYDQFNNDSRWDKFEQRINDLLIQKDLNVGNIINVSPNK